MRGWVVAAALVLVAGGTGTTGAAEIAGKLLNGSQPGGVVPRHPVRLTARLASQERLERDGVTDEAGRFRFADVPGDTADVYVVSASLGGVDYASRLLRFALGETSLAADLLVYESTSDPSTVRQIGHHYIFEPAPAVPALVVTEVVGLANSGVRAYVGEEPLLFPLPENATDVEFVEGFDGAFAAHGAVHSSRPLRPGNTEGAFRYTLPGGFPFTFSATQKIPTDEITVLVTPPGTKLRGEGLTPVAGGPLDLGDGHLYDRFQVAVPPLGQAFTLVVDAAQPRVSHAPWLFVLALLLASAALMTALERRQAGRPARQGRETASLVSERDRQLRELLALEKRQANGGLSGEEYQAARRRLLERATALQEIIDQMAERGT